MKPSSSCWWVLGRWLSCVASRRTILRMELKGYSDRTAAVQLSRFRSSNQQDRGDVCHQTDRCGGSVLQHPKAGSLSSRPNTTVCRHTAMPCRFHFGHCIILNTNLSSPKVARWPRARVQRRRAGKWEAVSYEGQQCHLAGTIDVWSSYASTSSWQRQHDTGP